LLRLWKLKDVKLLTSSYAAGEARINLETLARQQRLESLLQSVRLVAEPGDLALPAGVSLPPKDRPILLAAIAAEATHLLTGDRRDFGRYFGRSPGGVRVMRPGDYLRER